VKALFPFVVIGTVTVASCATVSALWLTHFAIIAPWPTLAVGASTGLAITFVQSRKPLRPTYQVIAMAVAAFLCLSWANDMATDIRYHRAMSISGGLGAHSDATEDLSAWLLEYSYPAGSSASDSAPAHQPAVVAMDWGIAAPVTFLTQGRVTPIEAFGYNWETDAQFSSRLQNFIQTPGSLFVWRAPDEIIFDRSDEFQAMYRPLELEEDILAAFYERSGRPVLGVTHLVDLGKAKNRPLPVDKPD
jgi:hypothetical protein